MNNYSNKKPTPFQILVWNEINKIPVGKTKSYNDIARILGKSGAARAVANACGQNPYPIKVPCHRVIRSDGSLGGYSGPGGVKMKKLLLDNEKT